MDLPHPLIIDTFCQTIDNFNCTYPFFHEGNEYWTCIDSPMSGLSKGTLWCPTDANKNGKFKSVGECKSNCPQGEL